VTVQAASLELLEKAEVPPSQARAIVQAIEIEIAGAKETLATKHDILLLHQELAGMKSDLRQEMVEMKSDLRREIAELRGDLRGETHAVAATHMRQMYAAMLGQLAVLLGIAYFFVTHLTH